MTAEKEAAFTDKKKEVVEKERSFIERKKVASEKKKIIILEREVAQNTIDLNKLSEERVREKQLLIYNIFIGESNIILKENDLAAFLAEEPILNTMEIVVLENKIIEKTEKRDMLQKDINLINKGGIKIEVSKLKIKLANEKISLKTTFKKGKKETIIKEIENLEKRIEELNLLKLEQ